MKKTLTFIILIYLCLTSVKAQETYQSAYVINCPTAATLDRGSYTIGLEAYALGGLNGKVNVGLTNRMMLGVGYGGKNIIGSGPIEWNPTVGVHLRYRVIDEELTFPAISVGFDNQGHGGYLEELERYAEKSKGVFVAFSKSFSFLGALALHGGANYSFETKDGDKDLNGYIGVEKSINEEFALFAEYDLAINDNTGKSIGAGDGYLNAGLKWIFEHKLYIDFLWVNILKNNKRYPYSNREIKISYVESF
jgi:hypothetical protein